MSRSLRSLGVLALLAVACLVGTTSAASASSLAHSKSCSGLGSYPGSAGGYWLKLSVTGVGCDTGKKVMKAHYKCRTKKGATGRCVSKVSGYSCRETRKSIPTEFDATVTCSKGSKKIKFSYQQNT